MAELLRMPKLSLTMTAGRIEEWLKHEGEQVSEGESLATIESDKTMFELPAPSSGTLRRILVEAGQEVNVETPIAVIGDPKDDISSLLAPDTGSQTAAIQESQAGIPAVSTATIDATKERQRVSPVARRVAKELGIDVSSVTGTGVGGLVTEKDVRNFYEKMGGDKQPGDDVEVIPLSGIRRRMAERMALSRRTAADVTTVVDVDMNQVSERRGKEGLSYTAYVAWATSSALGDFPLLNSTFGQDGIRVNKRVHLGVAVALENGLVVPVIRDAHRKSLGEIGTEIDRLAELAREGKLPPDSLSGSTFTITNSGAFGTLLFTPIINLPEVAILGMGKVADTPVVQNGAIVVHKLMYLCLSYDHRVVEGAIAVQFLQGIKKRLEAPAQFPK